MSREAHARFCERRRVRLPPPTLLLVLCATREQAEAALGRLRDLLAELGLEPKAAKTRIVHLTEGGEGFDFLAATRGRMVRAGSLNGGSSVMTA